VSIDDQPRYEIDRQTMRDRAGALAEACGRALRIVIEDPAAVRGTGRALGIDKSLASKLVRLAQTSDPDEIFGVLPGRQGWNKILAGVDAIDETGVAGRMIRDAVDAFEAEAATRGISGATIRAWAKSRGQEAMTGSPVASDQGRADLTQANTGIWGIGCTAILRSFIVRPSDDEDRERLAVITTVHGLHRTRRGPEWPIHPIEGAEADPSLRPEGHGDVVVSIDCDDLCTPDVIEDVGILKTRTGHFRTFRGDRTGPANRIDLVCVEVLPAAASPEDAMMGMATDAMEASVSAAGPKAMRSLESPILVPANLAVIDVFVDRRMAPESFPQSWGAIQAGGITLSSSNQSEHRFPIPEETQGPMDVDLLNGRWAGESDGKREGEDEVSSKAWVAHATAIRRAMSALELETEELVRYRLEVAHPPLATTIGMSWPRPE
jgi:hypothetical protein